RSRSTLECGSLLPLWGGGDIEGGLTDPNPLPPKAVASHGTPKLRPMPRLEITIFLIAIAALFASSGGDSRTPPARPSARPPPPRRRPPPVHAAPAAPRATASRPRVPSPTHTPAAPAWATSTTPPPQTPTSIPTATPQNPRAACDALSGQSIAGAEIASAR